MSEVKTQVPVYPKDFFIDPMAEYVEIHERYVERPDGVYYLWKQVVNGVPEKNWHEKLTGMKTTPYVVKRHLHKTEFYKLKEATKASQEGK